MSYYFNKALTNIEFEAAIEKVTEELKKEGFGVLTEIDVKKTLKEKIDVDFKNMDINEKFRDEWEKFGMFDLQMKNPEPTFRAYSMANHPTRRHSCWLL